VINEYQELITQKRNVLYVPENKYKDINFIDLFSLSDGFIVDMSSALVDCILTDKPIIFALGKNHQIEKYKPIKEIFDASQKITVENINDVLTKSLNTGIDKETWATSKNIMFYNLKGDAIQSLTQFIDKLQKQ